MIEHIEEMKKILSPMPQMKKISDDDLKVSSLEIEFKEVPLHSSGYDDLRVLS